MVPRPNAQILFKCLLAEGARSQISANPAALSGVVHVKLGQLPPSPSALPFVRPEQCRAKYVHKQLVTLHFQVDFRALVSIVALLSYDHTSTTGNLKLIQGIRNLRRVVNSPSERFKQTSGASETHRRVSKPFKSSEHIQKPTYVHYR